jgi:MFS superfamily sulfate permease-like transporter
MTRKILPTSDGFVRVLPVLEWLPRYDPGWLRADVIAGVTLWGILVPEAIAYELREANALAPPPARPVVG